MRSGGIFDLDRKRSRIALIDRETTQPNFWDDNTKAQGLLKEKSQMEASLGEFDTTWRGLDDADALWELGESEKDASVEAEVQATLQQMEARVRKMELARMLSGESDHCSAFMEVNAGA